MFVSALPKGFRINCFANVPSDKESTSMVRGNRVVETAHALLPTCFAFAVCNQMWGISHGAFVSDPTISSQLRQFAQELNLKGMLSVLSFVIERGREEE